MTLRSLTSIGMRSAALALIGLATVRADAAPMYRITDLGSLDVRGISNAGQVIGEEPYAIAWPRHRSVIYQNGSITPVTVPGSDEVVSDAVISPGGTIAYSGGRIGEFFGSLGPTAHVLKDGRVTDAGTAENGNLMGGGPHSMPHAVSDRGIVAGESHARDHYSQAFMSTPGPDGKYTPIALGANGGTVSAALAVNRQGTVVGWTDVPGQWKNHAFVLGGPYYVWGGSSLHDLGTLGGQHSSATGINDKGLIVGWSSIATDWKRPDHYEGYYTPEPTHAFLYDGKMNDLGTLPGFRDSSAAAINAQGQIVGNSSRPAADDPTGVRLAFAQHAILYENGNMNDLNSLIDPVSHWLLENAVGINDVGQIIGKGTFDGASHSFLLTPLVVDPSPVPEPSVLPLFGLMAAVLLARAIRG